MKRFKLYNNIVGWAVFAIAAVTYLLTIESTASFWDCGEFISTAYKLDVGHPPGAPFFMLTAHFFTLFAKDPTTVAVMVNAMSAIFSALTILFLFWTITALARKIVVRQQTGDDKQNAQFGDMTLAQGIGILFAGAVGALAYTFSDTFWFSAVEGEVYAYSSFFTAVVFWAILKWDDVADNADSDRWIILIAYLMGLSIGVHLLNLLAIPAIVLVCYFRKYQPTFKGFVVAMLVAVVLLAVVLYGLIPGFVQMACWFELLFTNQFGMPFNTGLIVYIVLAVGVLAWAAWQTTRDDNYNLNALATVAALTAVGIPVFGRSDWTALVVAAVVIGLMALALWLFRRIVTARLMHTIVISAALMLLGYSSYAVIVIRSGSDPSMDQNSPDNVFNLKYYLNREQYGDRPLLYGPAYNAPVDYTVNEREGRVELKEKVGPPLYAPKPKTSPDEKDRYVITGYKHDYVMDKRFMMLFPRMYSSQASHVEAYKEWGDVKGKRIKYKDFYGESKVEYKPTFVENIRFFIAYQCHFMYWRYFMWNFAGRQNDLQSHGEVDRGNWITGISFLDNLMLGDQSKLPDRIKNNKGHNVYYMLPLLLGLFGIGFQLSRGKKGMQNFLITFLLFFLTGIAIVVYLNQTPYQPRERDYAYAGSFYAFCIWIGMGVLALIQTVEDITKGRLSQAKKTIVATVIGLVCLGVPALMAQQNWDDHDRSGRYVCRDFGQNYLNSCRENAIIFTNGDNDTFPLWYNQEVEEYRTDVRVCNLSYLQTDWYIDQMKRPYYLSEPLPITWKPNQYQAGTNEMAWVRRQLDSLTIDQAFNWMLTNTDKRQQEAGDKFWAHEDVTSEIPTGTLYQPIVPEQVLASPAFKQGDTCRFKPEQMAQSIKIPLRSRLTRSEMMILDIIRNNQWKRPVYFAVTVGSDYYLHIDDYFELTGLAYQLTPVKHNGYDAVNTVDMYDNMMHKFSFGGIEQQPIYLDENVMRMCHTHRLMFGRLADALIEEGDYDKALEVLDYGLEHIPSYNVPHDYSSLSMAQCYYILEQNDKGDNIINDIAQNAEQYIDYYYSLDKMRRRTVEGHYSQAVAILGNALQIAYRAQRDDIVTRYQDVYMKNSMR